MTKTELIESLSDKIPYMPSKDVDSSVKILLEHMTETLATGERIEIRGFGSFSLSYRPSKSGRNPKTGEPVIVAPKHVPRFKPGRELRERVNQSKYNFI